MERLISLFKEADYDQWSPSQPQPPPQEQFDQPLYFQQLLEYLRQERSGPDEGQAAEAEDDDAELLIGADA